MANEMRVSREDAKLYINDNGNITQEKTSTVIRKHNFYGQE